MKRGIITALAITLAWSVHANFACAQFGNLGQPPIRPRPTVSPFINLGTGGAMSYYGLIRPQTDTTKSIMELQSVVTRMNPDGSLQGQFDQTNPASQTGSQTGLQTGHSASYFNYGRYYPNSPPMGSGSGLGGAGFGTGLGGSPVGGGGFGTNNMGFGNRTFFGPTMNNAFGR